MWIFFFFIGFVFVIFKIITYLLFIYIGVSWHFNIMVLFIFLFHLNFFNFFEMFYIQTNSQDIFLKSFLLFKHFYNSSKLEIKKFFTFFLSFRIHETKKIFLYIFKHVWSHYLLFWRPLFKKWSYFGYYRTNRSKWIR